MKLSGWGCTAARACIYYNEFLQFRKEKVIRAPEKTNAHPVDDVEGDI
jgi:hypothetical protein